MDQFKYTISWTQSISPSMWDLSSMSQHLVKIRNQAYEAEEKLIELQLEKAGFDDANSVLAGIMRKL